MIKFFVIIIIAIIISGGLWAACFMSGKMDTYKCMEMQKNGEKKWVR